MGKIELTVVAARNLHDAQLFGMPDPFVRLSIDDKKYKTKVIQNTLSPEWNETFRFMIADDNSSQIRLEVWNKNVASDDLMGYYTFSVGGLTKGVVKDQWYILQKSKTQAELHVRVLAVDFGQPVKPEDQWMVTSDISRDPVKRAIEDGTWRPGQTRPPPPSGPPQPQVVQQVVQPQPQQVQYAQPQPQPVQYVQQQQPQPQVQQPVQYAPQPVQYVQQPPQQVQYAQPQPVQYVQQQPQPVQYVQQPVQYAPQPPMQYAPQPPVQYAPAPMPGYAPQGYAPQGYPPQQPQYSPQPGYRY